MKEELLKYISKFDSLTEQEATLIADNIPVKKFPKGTILLKQGEIHKEGYFVLSGCLRQYYLKDGEEKTTAFFTEEEAAVSFTSYAEQKPANFFMSCVEDCTLIICHPNHETEMYEKFPKLEIITRMMVEQDLGKTQDALANFITSSPEERYLHLQKTRPDLLQRVPQHQLASFLGVTPESLSRIRKRLFNKK